MRLTFAIVAAAQLVGSGCSTPHERASEQPLQAAAAQPAPSSASSAKGASDDQRVFTSAPLTDGEVRDVRRQVENNWNLGDLASSPDLKDMVVELRVHLLPDGTVTKIDLLNDRPNNPVFQRTADSARRAVMIASPLKLPPGKSWETIKLVFHPGRVIE